MMLQKSPRVLDQVSYACRKIKMKVFVSYIVSVRPGLTTVKIAGVRGEWGSKKIEAKVICTRVT